jgi:DNA-binding transcriptional MerR regulator
VLIGELARRTGVSARLLRYYEEQGLLNPGRDASGYRDYPETAVGTVARIRDLLEAGLSTGAIRKLLPCAGAPGPGVLNCGMSVGVLDERRTQLDAQIDVLTRQRALLARHYDATVAHTRDHGIESAS